MGFRDVTSAAAVRHAIAEFDELGREAFLRKYGFGPARRYFVKEDDRFYDSKAIVGAAHGLQYPSAGPLRHEDFSGGEATVKAKLEELGFQVVDRSQGRETIHLVVKWSARYGADTVDLHRQVANEQSAVWWGLYSADKGWRVSNDWIAQLHAQIASGVDTFAFLSGPTCWRTRLQGVEYEQSATEKDLIPDYYDQVDRHYHLWVRLADFEPVDRDWLMRMLEPVRNPGKLVVLSNQTNPLIVHVRTRPRFWWVNQGQSYQRAREGGYIWAPERDKRGSELPHWRAMRYLKEGDVIFHYANTQIRARGSVLGLAERHGRPSEEADQAWGDAGYLARIDYRDVDPVPLTGIPEAWRMKEGGPFTSDGRVQQGYLYPVSDGFAAKLAGRFPQLPIEVEAAADFGDVVELVPPFDLEAVRSAAVDRGLILDDTTYAALLSALESGKHVILTGPPGTAKTTLAEVVAEVAARAGRCNGYVLTTATADWTTYETIGGLKPDAQSGLAFAEGHFLEAIEKNQWLVIDELNRSNFDRAFGQLFTVLSGQAVEIPYERRVGAGRIVIRPAAAANVTTSGDIIEVPASWRVLATMNVFDKSLLFEMSFALMRRFAFVEVPAPRLDIFHSLIDRAAEPDAQAATLAKRFLTLRRFKDIGPAVFMDLARFLRIRREMGAAPDAEIAFQGFYGYLLPQFEGIDQAAGEALYSEMRPVIGGDRAERLRLTLNAVLGLQLVKPDVGSVGGDDRQASPSLNTGDDSTP